MNNIKTIVLSTIIIISCNFMITFLAVATLAGEIKKESAKAEQYMDAMGQHLMKITTLTNDTTDGNYKKFSRSLK